MAREFRSIDSFNSLTLRQQRELMATQIAVRGVMDVVTSDPARTLLVVAGGAAHWRIQFRRAMHGFRLVDDSVADALFNHFAEIVVSLYGDAKPSEILDSLEIHEQRPPTEKEINEAWTVDSFSTDEGRKFFYGDRHPMEVVRQLFTES